MDVLQQFNAKILIVEDDPAIRDALTQLLEDEGYPVVGVANGQEAIEHLRTAERPHLILLDLMMPVMNGMQFLQAQQHDAAIAGIPVIVLSAVNNIEQKVSSFPVQGFLRKPITFTSLFTIVEQYCNVNSA